MEERKIRRAKLATSLGGVAQVEVIQSENDLTRSPDYIPELIHSDFLPETCPLFRQTTVSYKDFLVRKPESHHVLTEEAPVKTDSALKVSEEIVNELFARSVTPEPSPKKKSGIKHGWMTLRKVLPNFEMDDATFNDLLFRENLLVSYLDESESYPVPVGALSLDVQSARGGPLRDQNEKTESDFIHRKFLVHLSSQFDCKGHNGGSRIMSWVDKNLQTLEETRKEFLKKDDEIDKECLYINSQQDFYYMRHNQTKDIYYSPQKAVNLICEGASFILMRYLALKRFVGTLEVCTAFINGDLCINIYSSKGPQSGIVYNQKLDVCKIERVIVERCGIEHKSITLMTLSGRILKHEWQGCNYLLQLNPQISPLTEKPDPAEHIPLDKTFEKDLQLFSLYLDAKVANKKKIDSYMTDHPEIKSFVSDYVATILHLKPDNVFEFTAKYFLGFAPQLLPYSEYFQPSSDENENDELDFGNYF